MPWRKPWIDPTDSQEDTEELAKVLSKRAYEVWVSEIMLQQTRVSTVIPYFNNWISKWPTVQDLAKAEHDDVLAAWKGLGYYSRATRLHQGAKDMVAKNGDGNEDLCPIPRAAEELMGFSGIGRYTAGAISSIAFGEAEPVLDGNVVRVLSRQLGLYADGKDKKSSDFLWKVADRLVKHVAGFPEKQRSEVPALWNQALMELGSTVCTPRPKCEGCPIRNTCRAYAEGEKLAGKVAPAPAVLDIEDACNICEELSTEDLQLVNPEEEELEEGDVKITKKRKRETKPANTISQYFTVTTRSTRSEARTDPSENPEVPQSHGTIKRKAPSPTDTKKSRSVAAYCSLFPKKVPKKKVAEEECVVCLVEVRTPGKPSKWLVEQRPAKGKLSPTTQYNEQIAICVPV
jgi:A/G-specific adenine glycosylase